MYTHTHINEASMYLTETRHVSLRNFSGSMKIYFESTKTTECLEAYGLFLINKFFMFESTSPSTSYFCYKKHQNLAF